MTMLMMVMMMMMIMVMFMMVTLIYLYNNSFEDKDTIYTNEDDDGSSPFTP